MWRERDLSDKKEREIEKERERVGGGRREKDRERGQTMILLYMLCTVFMLIERKLKR